MRYETTEETLGRDGGRFRLRSGRWNHGIEQGHAHRYACAPQELAS